MPTSVLIVGGENDFFEKIVRAVGNGKAVDRTVNNSHTLTDIKNTRTIEAVYLAGNKVN